LNGFKNFEDLKALTLKFNLNQILGSKFELGSAKIYFGPKVFDVIVSKNFQQKNTTENP